MFCNVLGKTEICPICGRSYIIPHHPDDIEGWEDFKAHEEFHAKLRLAIRKFGYIEANISKIGGEEDNLFPVIFSDDCPLEERVKAAEKVIEYDFYRIILDEISDSENIEFLDCVSKKEHFLISITTNKESFPEEVINELRDKYLK